MEPIMHNILAFTAHSFVQCCLHCGGLQMSHVSLSFPLSALLIWSYLFEPVQSLRLSTHVRLGLPLPRLPSSRPSIVVSRVSYSKPHLSRTR